MSEAHPIETLSIQAIKAEWSLMSAALATKDARVAELEAENRQLRTKLEQQQPGGGAGEPAKPPKPLMKEMPGPALWVGFEPPLAYPVRLTVRTREHSETVDLAAGQHVAFAAVQGVPVTRNWQYWSDARIGDGPAGETAEIRMAAPPAPSPPAPGEIKVIGKLEEGRTFTSTLDLERKDVTFRRCKWKGIRGGWPHNNGVWARQCNLVFEDCEFEDISHQGIEAYGGTLTVRRARFDKVWEPIHTEGVTFDVDDVLAVRTHRIPGEFQGSGTRGRVTRFWVEGHDKPYRDSFGLSVACYRNLDVYVAGNVVIADSPNDPNAADEVDPYRDPWKSRTGRYGMGIEIAGRKAVGEFNLILGPFVCGYSALSDHQTPEKSDVTLRNSVIAGIRSKWGSDKEVIADGGSRVNRGEGLVIRKDFDMSKRPQWPGWNRPLDWGWKWAMANLPRP